MTPLSVDFGSKAVGKTSANKVVTVKNVGTGNPGIGTLSVGGADTNQFTTALDRCSNVTLAPGKSCKVSVRFAPTVTGDKTATLTIPSDDPDENPVNVSLSGTGTP